jgi:long-subunit acyl-CoA synthetase (AMP-forming)
MITFHELLKENYEKRKNEDYVYTKVNGTYHPISFGRMMEHTAYLAEALLAMQLKGKKIIVYGENSVEWMISDLAIMSYVGISVGIDKEWQLQDIKNVIEFVHADAIIYCDSKKEIIDTIKTEFKDMICISMQDDLPSLIEKGKNINAQKGELFDFEKRDHEECLKVVFTSGTTCFPKAVMLSEKNIFSGWNSLKKRAPMDGTDICYLFLPLHHTYAGIYNFLYSLISGMKIYLSSGTDQIYNELSEVQPTVFCGVPLIYKRLYEAVGRDIKKLPVVFGKKIKYMFTGGAYLEEQIREDYREAGLNLLTAYALSETASSLSIEYSQSKNLKSVGKIFEDIEVKIDQPNERGEGEILVRGDNVFIGYMNNEEATRFAFDSEGYFRTGDLGYIDEENNLYLSGRKKRIILMDNGENIYPDNIEQKIIRKNENISSAKVFLSDNKLKANIYIKSEDAVDYQKFVEDLNKELPKYERIGSFEVLIDSLDKRLKQ